MKTPPDAGPETRPPRAGAQPSAMDRRLADLLARENLRRTRVTALSVTGALAAIAPVIAIIVGLPDALYYHALILLFIASVWTQYLVSRRYGPATWRAFAFVAFNFALLTYTLINPNPFAQEPVPPTLLLRFGNFVYFFIMLAALAFSFSPALVLWGGVCGATFWSLGRLWALAVTPGATLHAEASGPDAAAFATLSPGYIDPGVWVAEVAAFLVVAGMLAQVVRGSRSLIAQQARLERRGANLARYVPRPMAERMAQADEPFVENREVTAAIMFTDVVGFTGWAEARDPDAVVTLLREVHALVADEVFRSRGVLDKFIGDGAMATFGVASLEGDPDPPTPPELARRALGCADRILAAAARWNAERIARGDDPVRLSLGLHLGEVVVGDVGSSDRMELAAVGDTVNVASRLEALTRPLHCAAVASAELITAAGTPPSVWRFRGVQSLPGRRGAETVWTRDHDPADPALRLPWRNHFPAR